MATLFLLLVALLYSLGSPPLEIPAEGLVEALFQLSRFLNSSFLPGLVSVSSRGARLNMDGDQQRDRVELCVVSVGYSSAPLFEFLYRFFPFLDLHVLESDVYPDYGRLYYDFLEREYGGRGEEGGRRGSLQVSSTLEAGVGGCDLIMVSHDTFKFSWHKLAPLLSNRASPVGLLLNLGGCTFSTSHTGTDNFACELVFSSWKHSICGHLDGEDDLHGCGDQLCMCWTHPQAIVDPVHTQIDCPLFQEGNIGTAQWGQDWFLYHNVFKYLGEEEGVYVDVGAADPFLLSNSAVFEQCFGWKGVCIEPNPRSASLLFSHRTCQVLPFCAWSTSGAKAFPQLMEMAGVEGDSRPIHLARGYEGREILPTADVVQREGRWGAVWVIARETSSRDGSTKFDAHCFTMEELLQISAAKDSGLKEVSLLSIDVEHEELEVLTGFPFSRVKPKAITVEVHPDTAAKVDALLLPWGYIKVSMLGSDAVYIHSSIVPLLPASVWPFLNPENIETPSGSVPFLSYQAFFWNISRGQH